MKRLLLTLLVCALCAVVEAQYNNTPTAVKTPPPVSYSVNFNSQHGEAFSVYIDGELQNRLPSSRVIVNEVSDKTHEVVVVLKRPVDKAAVLKLRPGERTVIVNVNYDPRLEQLYLYTAAHNRPEELVVNTPKVNRTILTGTVVDPLGKKAETKMEMRIVTDDEVDSMLVRMRAQPFDNDRLSLGKVIVASSHLTAMQIARLAETIDFSNSQVEFLKYSYGYCIDPTNYFRAVDVLTFTADKRKVLDYIATQK
jgi:hypothetical protein